MAQYRRRGEGVCASPRRALLRLSAQWLNAERELARVFYRRHGSVTISHHERLFLHILDGGGGWLERRRDRIVIKLDVQCKSNQQNKNYNYVLMFS